MYLVGIDIAKYKHTCFIATETGEVINDSFDFDNTSSGFDILLSALSSLKGEVRIGLEATGHYGMNLKLFLVNHKFTFLEFNPYIVSRFIKATTLRKTKTDKADAKFISLYLLSVDYNTYSSKSYQNYSLKSLTRFNESITKQHSRLLLDLTNILDLIFPEFKPFFGKKFTRTSVYLLNTYLTPDKMKNMNFKSFDKITTASKGRFKFSKFVTLKELAADTIGSTNELLTFQLSSILSLLNSIKNVKKEIDAKIFTIITELNPPLLSIPGVGIKSAAVICSEYGNFHNFSNSKKLLAFAGLDPAIYQSGESIKFGRMVKRGSSSLRQAIMNVTISVVRYNPIFYLYYHKKRNEGKAHRVALTHVARKLLRVIYHLEITNTKFDISKLV